MFAGLAASGAILIRPNLAPLAGVLVLWRWWSVHPAKDAALIALGTIPGCLFIAWTNNRLYGSPLASGYGSLSSLFSAAHIAVNLERYGRWLLESQTPLAIAGIGVARRANQASSGVRAGQRRAALLLAATIVVVWTLYLIYHAIRSLVVFEVHACRRGRPSASVWRPSWFASDNRHCLQCALAAIGVAIAIGGTRPLAMPSRNGAFPSGEGDHRYVSIAKMVEQATDPSAIVFSGQHSGPIRYYAGRTIIRYELLDPAWLDRAVEWLAAQGRRPYFLLEEYEVPEFEKRFVAANSHGRLTLAPIVEYRAPGVPGAIYLFDPARPDGGELITSPPSDASRHASCRRLCYTCADPMKVWALHAHRGRISPRRVSGCTASRDFVDLPDAPRRARRQEGRLRHLRNGSRACAPRHGVHVPGSCRHRAGHTGQMPYLFARSRRRRPPR